MRMKTVTQVRDDRPKSIRMILVELARDPNLTYAQRLQACRYYCILTGVEPKIKAQKTPKTEKRYGKLAEKLIAQIRSEKKSPEVAVAGQDSDVSPSALSNTVPCVEGDLCQL